MNNKKFEEYNLEKPEPFVRGVMAHIHDGINAPRNYFRHLEDRPTLIERTATSVDLSGAAATLIVFHTERKAELVNAYLLYTEASSNNAGIVLKIGKETDDDYYYLGASEVSKDQWYTNQITLLKIDIMKGDTITFYSAGSKTGTGEIMLIIEYKFVEAYCE